MQPPESSGLSLLETVISMAIFSLIFLILVTIYPTALLSGKRGEQMLVVSSIATQELERLKSSDFAELVTKGLPPRTVQGTTYAIRVEVSPVLGADPERIRNVRVIVSWENRGARAYELATSILKPE
ncbi:MAG: hypothetical protein HYU64_18230 [Armatimonadetes bacterium]|nr:hypothetical protein [Armatimonadota bacterium]